MILAKLPNRRQHSPMAVSRCLDEKLRKKGWAYNCMVEHLPSMPKALDATRQH